MNIQPLIDHLTHESEAERMNAAEDLGYADTPDAIAPLAERLLVEPSRKVKETLFSALERIHHPSVLERMALLFESDDPFLRNQAIALLQRKGAAAVPVLMARINDPDPDIRKFVLDTAAGISIPEIEPIYEAALKDSDVNVLIAVLEYLGEQRKQRFKPEAEKIFIEATEPMLICAAFAALLQIGDEGSWKCILQRYPTPATVPNWELGWWIRGLGDFGLPNEIDFFHEILKKNDGEYFSETREAFERFQSRHRQLEVKEKESE